MPTKSVRVRDNVPLLLSLGTDAPGDAGGQYLDAA
jgi:hypothetical protein